MLGHHHMASILSKPRTRRTPVKAKSIGHAFGSTIRAC